MHVCMVCVLCMRVLSLAFGTSTFAAGICFCFGGMASAGLDGTRRTGAGGTGGHHGLGTAGFGGGRRWGRP